jgi:hypothetical protein
MYERKLLAHHRWKSTKENQLKWKEWMENMGIQEIMNYVWSVKYPFGTKKRMSVDLEKILFIHLNKEEKYGWESELLMGLAHDDYLLLGWHISWPESTRQSVYLHQFPEVTEIPELGTWVAYFKSNLNDYSIMDIL